MWSNLIRKLVTHRSHKGCLLLEWKCRKTGCEFHFKIVISRVKKLSVDRQTAKLDKIAFFHFFYCWLSNLLYFILSCFTDEEAVGCTIFRLTIIGTVCEWKSYLLFLFTLLEINCQKMSKNILQETNTSINFLWVKCIHYSSATRN